MGKPINKTFKRNSTQFTQKKRANKMTHGLRPSVNGLTPSRRSSPLHVYRSGLTIRSPAMYLMGIHNGFKGGRIDQVAKTQPITRQSNKLTRGPAAAVRK